MNWLFVVGWALVVVNVVAGILGLVEYHETKKPIRLLYQGPLIKIGDSFYIHVDDIRQARRVGHYTEILRFNGSMLYEWDQAPEMPIWKQIERFPLHDLVIGKCHDFSTIFRETVLDNGIEPDLLG